MIKIGEFNELKVLREVSFGYYLDGGTGRKGDDILLPVKNTMDRKLREGDIVNAFIYRDSSDRRIATLKNPVAKVGELAYLRVASKTNIGCFLDFGLERDILVPMREQLYKLQEEKSYLVYIYVDKTERLAATTNIDDHLETVEEDNVEIGKEVMCTVYGIEKNGKLLVAIDNKYKAHILGTDYFVEINPGDQVKVRIKKQHLDGTLEVTPRESLFKQRNTIEDKIMDYLTKNEGLMPYNDNSSADAIKKEFGESKNYFKKALGGLMKKGLIVQEEYGTRLKSKVNK